MYPTPNTLLLQQFENSFNKHIEQIEKGRNSVHPFLSTEKLVEQQSKVLEASNEQTQKPGLMKSKLQEFGTKQISEIDRFEIKPLGIPLSEIPNFLTVIYDLLDESIAKSNNPPNEVFLKTENDYDRQYLAITFENKIHGLACIGYD